MDQKNEVVSPCLGGWCVRRTCCAHYLSPTTRQEPSERLCKRGGPDHFVPLGSVQRQGVPA